MYVCSNLSQFGEHLILGPNLPKIMSMTTVKKNKH